MNLAAEIHQSDKTPIRRELYTTLQVATILVAMVGGALKFQGGSEKKRSLQILDLQRLASLLYVYICTSEWGQEEC